MVKQIVRDIFFLGQPSKPATKADIQIGKDLQDTLQANREWCVGMAANMIGVRKNIIIVNMGFIDVVMFTPGFSMAGPLVTFSLLPISLAMIPERVVFPSPGGP